MWHIPPNKLGMGNVLVMKQLGGSVWTLDMFAVAASTDRRGDSAA
jgi:hypothetical protein